MLKHASYCKSRNKKIGILGAITGTTQKLASFLFPPLAIVLWSSIKNKIKSTEVPSPKSVIGQLSSRQHYNYCYKDLFSQWIRVGKFVSSQIFIKQLALFRFINENIILYTITLRNLQRTELLMRIKLIFVLRYLMMST